MIRLVLRGRVTRRSGVLAVLGAVVVTYLLTAGPIRAAGANPVAAYQRYVLTPLTTPHGIAEVLLAATPLLFTGLAVMIAFRAGYFNIGAEGQFLAGTVGAAAVGLGLPGLPAAVALPLAGLAGAAAGVAWAALPAWLRIRMRIDEVVTTLLLNPVALLLVQGLLNGPWRNPETGFPESARLGAGYVLPSLGGTRVHWGLVVAVLAIVVTGVVMTATPTGLRVRAAGQAPEAARFSGIAVDRVQGRSALVSGGIAGLGGAVQVCGVQHQLTGGISDGYGYTGVVVATLGALTAVGVLLVGVLLGTITVGAQNASIVLHLPPQMGDIVTALLLLTVVCALVLRRYRVVLRRRPTRPVPAADREVRA
ncbi:ABC transporter permease [Actinomycetota bacterium]|nr:ABC transporter permease [Actinomycetota bacterium]